MRLLISSLQGITNALLNGQLVPQVRPDMRRQNKTPTLKEDRGFVVPLIGLEPIRYFYRGILSNYRNGVVKSFAEKTRENRGKKEFLMVKSVERRSIAVTFRVRESKYE